MRRSEEATALSLVQCQGAVHAAVLPWPPTSLQLWGNSYRSRVLEPCSG